MSEFSLYYQLGMEHILDIRGYDHLLFVVALSVLYQLSDWKKVLVLVTAFTVGHSITLALATLSLIRVNVDLIELLIPVTIVVTALSNLFVKEGNHQTARKFSINYLFAGFFGLIHGMGFSNYLKSLLGRDQSILTQLFAFNIGLEVGQIIIVGLFLLVSFIFVSILGVVRRDWKMIISSAVAGIALMMLLEAAY
ncbi:MAG: HupE/UreJ family protein [Cyclobacteriaceae bacterium]|nr:HupE/UreJ family protein [Cyclobacteriaceae bacterium]